LGFGVLTSVAPASADASSPTSVTVGTIPAAQVGVTHSTPVTVAFPAGLASDTFTVNVRVTSAPTGSAYRSLNASSASERQTISTTGLSHGVTAAGNTVTAKITVTQSTATGILQATSSDFDDVTVGALFTAGPGASTAGSASFLINVVPDQVGSYTVLVSTHCGSTADAGTCAAAGVTATNDSQAYAAGDANSAYSFTTGAAVTAVALSASTGSSTVGTTGQVIKATLTGALGLNEVIAVSTNSSTARLQLVSDRSTSTPTVDGGLTTISMTSAHFINGVGYFRIYDSAAKTIVITAAGSGLLSPTISSTLSVETVAAYAPLLVTMSDTAANVTAGGQAGHVGYTAATDIASTAATSHSYLATVTAGTAGDYLTVTVADSKGKASGVTGLSYTYALAMATTTTATVTVGAACTAVGSCFTATVSGTTPGVVAVTAAAPAQLTVAATGQLQQLCVQHLVQAQRCRLF